MILLRSALFNLMLPLWTIVVGFFWLPGVLLNWKLAAHGVRVWGMGISFFCRVILGIRFQVQGMEHVPDGPVILASKHQSAWETIVFMALFKRPAVVLKKELLKLPIFGVFARRALMIPVDRSASTKAMRLMLRAAEVAKGHGRPILFFPEGTRTAPGTMPDLHPGLAGLYRQLQLPVVPIALDSGHFWPPHSFRKFPGVIHVLIQPPIPSGLPRAELTERVHTAINCDPVTGMRSTTVSLGDSA